MTPIEKNIRVVDEQGNELEATYPKRAKGLVKNGRARFIDEQTICLACPPGKNLEDKKMFKHTENEQGTQTTKESMAAVESSGVLQPAEPQPQEPKVESTDTVTTITERTVLELLDRITSLIDNNGKLWNVYEPISSDAATDAYYDAYKEISTDRRMSVEKQMQMIQALLDTVRQLLDYLRSKGTQNRVDPKDFLDFVSKTAVENGAYVDYAALWNQIGR